MKTDITDLAVFGGRPLFDEPRVVGSPHVGHQRAFASRVQRIFENSRLSNNGPFVQEFESRIAECTGVRHCVATCNATVALQIACRALELSGEVIVPSFTFVATAHALSWIGLAPVFCDVDPDTHQIDPALVESLITPRTTAILGVHLWGRPCAVDALSQLADRRGLRLIFDAAQAFGCSYRGRMIGTFGDVEVFSFHATKCVNTAEGGALLTNDTTLARTFRLMRNFGMETPETPVSCGTNGKLNEVSAALGLTNLEDLNSVIRVNKRNYIAYHAALSNIPGLTLLPYDSAESSNYHYIVISIDPRQTGISRDQLKMILSAENVATRSYFKPGCHRIPPYRSPLRHRRLPVTEMLADQVLVLPTGRSVKPADVEQIAQLIRFAIANGSELCRHLVEEKSDLACTSPA